MSSFVESNVFFNLLKIPLSFGCCQNRLSHFYFGLSAAISYNVWRPCAGRISHTFVANRMEVHREDKDFEANAPQSPVREAGHFNKQGLLTKMQFSSRWRQLAVMRSCALVLVESESTEMLSTGMLK